MLGTKGRPGMFDNRIIPVEAHGLRVMSMGLLVADKQPLVWRGPMIHTFIQQMLRDVLWGPLDYLVFDMPPGTGDAQLSLSQVIPLSGVVMVTTPQDVALLDVRRAIAMFQQLNVPMLGVVENMSYFVAPDTGTRYTIFGEGGGQKGPTSTVCRCSASSRSTPTPARAATRARRSWCAVPTRRRPPRSARSRA